MKVLLVNTSERTGGAAIAASRLMHALNNHDVKAQLLVRDKQTDNPNVIAVRNPLMKARFVAERMEIFAMNRSRENLWAIDTGAYGMDITQLHEFKEADLIHIHWINQGMLSLADIGKILQTGKPVVWTMHDMWPITGICHHAEECENWQTHCHNCRLLQHPGEHDLSYRIFDKKVSTYGKGFIHFVACSEWLCRLALESPLTKSHDVVSIPNAIDTQFYVPGSKQAARERLGLPRDKRLLLFVALKATDKNKGIDYLIEATNIIAQRYPEWISQLGVVPVGLEAETLKNSFACDCYPQDYVKDSSRMRDLYQAADLLVSPTLMDNLPNTIVEAQACALPCVGFNIGGLPQMIKDGLNGYLARYKDADHFAELTLSTLIDEHYSDFCMRAHQMAESIYSERAVAEKYIELYESALKPASSSQS